MKGCENSMPMLVPEIVTEAYYGKPKELVKAESYLTKIREYISEEYDESKITDISRSIVDVNASQEHNMLEEAFKKAFNLGSVDITFYGVYVPIAGPAPINAFTMPQMFLSVKDKLGKKFKSTDLKVKIFIDKALIYYMDLTPTEIIAIILHELGHCFDMSTFHLLSNFLPPLFVLKNPKDIGRYLSQTVIGNVITSIARAFSAPLTKMIESIKTQSVLKPINTVLSGAVMMLMNIRVVQSILNVLGRGRLRVPTPEQIIMYSLDPRAFFGYAGEKYADSFATAYGYGVDIASSMAKMQYGAKNGFGGNVNIRKIPVLNVAYDFTNVLLSIPFAFADEHPDSSIRVYSQLRKLRRELNDPNLPKEFKKEIEDQITELEAMCERMTSYKESKGTGMFFTTLMNNINMKLFKGYADPREVLELIWRHEA